MGEAKFKVGFNIKGIDHNGVPFCGKVFEIEKINGVNVYHFYDTLYGFHQSAPERMIVAGANEIAAPPPAAASDAATSGSGGVNVNETFEALVKRQQETRDAMQTAEPGSLQHRILDDTLHSANYALAQHAEEAVAEIARLREQVDTLTRERDAAREALKPFAEMYNALLKAEREGFTGSFEEFVRRNQSFWTLAECVQTAANIVEQADAANALADGGE